MEHALTSRELCDRLIPHAQAIIEHIAPAARTRGRRMYLGSVAGEAGQSLHINPETGDWCDHSDRTFSGDILAFIREAQCDGDAKEAYKWGLRWLGEERPAPKLVQRTPEPPRRETLSANGRLIWAHAKPITKTDPAGRYLLARGCRLPPVNGDLRWLDKHEHPCGHAGPALIGLITKVVDASKQISLHQTWITSCGSGAKAFDHLKHLPKDKRPASRMYLAGHIKKGGCIRLWPDDSVTTGLGVGEGVETCLTLAKAFTPVWSLIDASELGELPYLNPIESITVAVDNDPAGEKAFASLAERWSKAGAEVWEIRAKQKEVDINDLVKERRYA